MTYEEARAKADKIIEDCLRAKDIYVQDVIAASLIAFEKELLERKDER